jgi:hypothetical protein
VVHDDDRDVWVTDTEKAVLINLEIDDLIKASFNEKNTAEARQMIFRYLDAKLS